MTASIDLSTATSKELVAFFNSLSDKKVTRFADRATALLRIGKLIRTPEVAAARKAAKNTLSADESSVYGQTIHGHTHCPACGTHLSNGIGEHNQDVNGKPIKHDRFQFACLACGEEFGPAIRNPSESGLLAIGVARSWTDPEVAAARSARHQVKLLGAGEANGVYKSLAQAIRAAHAPQPSNFIALRKSLVSEGQVSIGKFRFSLAA